MSGKKCKNCGSLDIEVDSARGDAVCTNCGSVLEDNIIVSEVQFEENAHGASSAIGQFVSADSKGGSSNFGASFHVGMGVESREITLRKARNGITTLCNQLRLNQHCIDTACNFFKMALARNLTRGRRNTHMNAACVYITCRTEGTPHMLIDISDVLQICCYELGRTYLRISEALCINIPALDPCLYVLRFAAKLELGSKTQEVANTALRLVQRMKRDSIHSGRRPAGLCGAALLIATRLHEFNRTPNDIVKIVKIHGSTLRKRLMEFGDTPSSTLTLDEFMTVDLEEEQDPPSFKAARKKDKERLMKIMEEDVDALSELQKEIDMLLDSGNKPKKVSEYDEKYHASRFINESTLGTIKKIMCDEYVDDPGSLDCVKEIKGLGPNVASMGLANSLEDVMPAKKNDPEIVEFSLDDIDDTEIDSYIVADDEFQNRNEIWHRNNAEYLEQQRVREEKLAKEKEEGKPEKKKRRTFRKKQATGPASSAAEAIEKMLQEKKVSSKINYEVLKSLTNFKAEDDPNKSSILENKNDIPKRRLSETDVSEPNIEEKPLKHSKVASSRRSKVKNLAPIGLPFVEAEKPEVLREQAVEVVPEDEFDEDYDEEPAPPEPEMGVLQMLRHHQQDHNHDDADEVFDVGYDEEDY